jgi:hypothetical protein
MLRQVLWACAIGCSSNTFEVAPSDTADATVSDAGGGDTAVSDSFLADTRVSTDTTTTLDARVDDTPAADAGPCRPFWCGCGACVATEIVCTRELYGCPLGCPSGECPEAEKPDICTSSGTGCLRNEIGGTQPCFTTRDCPAGKCCDGEYSPPSRGKCGAC